MVLGASYAKGKWAVGECARSGRKMLLRNMVADGYYPNLIVDPAWYEPKHPQESLPKVKDPTVLYRPAPERDKVNAIIDMDGLQAVTGFTLGRITVDAPEVPTVVLPPAQHQWDMDSLVTPEPDTGTG